MADMTDFTPDADAAPLDRRLLMLARQAGITKGL